ncbi:MAG: GWxTD domain-containing protein [Bryobacterales bacterium]|nr:GWxTD domain-containing protein [Bryobacterales bacterium]
MIWPRCGVGSTSRRRSHDVRNRNGVVALAVAGCVSGGGAGWMTDRGRVYSRLGPPDEIESHPVEGYEEWLCRHAVEGGVTFLHFDKGVLRK